MKQLQCFHSGNRTQKSQFQCTRCVNISLDTAPAAISVMRESLKKYNKDVQEFLIDDPIKRIGHVPTIKSKLSSNDVTDKTNQTKENLTQFIDRLANRYHSDPKIQELFRTDLLASFAEVKGISTIRESFLSYPKISDIEIQVKGNFVEVSGISPSGTKNIVSFMMLSNVRIMAQVDHVSALVASRQGRSEFADENAKKLGMSEEARPEKEPITAAAEELADRGQTDIQDLSDIDVIQPEQSIEQIVKETGLDPETANMIKNARDRERNYKIRMREERERVLTEAEMTAWNDIEVTLDDQIYEQWTDLDSTNPELLRHIPNIRTVENLLAQPPFFWGFAKLHKAISEGWDNNDDQVDIDDLVDQHGLGLGDADSLVEEHKSYAPIAQKYLDLKHPREGKQARLTMLETELGIYRKNPEENKDTITAYEKQVAELKQDLDSGKEEFLAAKKEYRKIKDRYEQIRDAFKIGRKILEELRPDKFYFDKIGIDETSYREAEKLSQGAKTFTGGGVLTEVYRIPELRNPGFLKGKSYLSSKDADGEYVPGIAMQKDLFEGWKTTVADAAKDDLDEDDQESLKAMSAAGLLKILEEVYGFEKLVADGHLQKVLSGPLKGSLILASLPEAFEGKSIVASKKDNPALYALLKSLRNNKERGFNYNKEAVQRFAIQKSEGFKKVEHILGMVFDQNHIGEIISGGEGDKMDIVTADGESRTVYKDVFTSFMTGEAAFEHNFEEIYDASYLQAVLSDKKDGAEASKLAEGHALEKTLELLNAYLEIGKAQSVAVSRIDILTPKISLNDLKVFNLSKTQIQLIQVGAAIAFAQAGEVDAMRQLQEPEANRDKYELVRKFLWAHPGLEEHKKNKIIEAINKINLGNLATYVKTNAEHEAIAGGAGYAYSFDLPYGLSFTVGAFVGGNNEGDVAAGGALGISKTHRLDARNKLTWSLGITSPTGRNSLGIPFFGANVTYTHEIKDSNYDFYAGASIGAGGGDFVKNVRAGVSIGFKANIDRSYSKARQETYAKMGLPELEKVMRDPNISIDTKVQALKTNGRIGYLVDKMANAFATLRKTMNKGLSKEVEEDLLLATYNIILNHAKLHSDVEWTPEWFGGIGINFELSENIFTSLAGLIGGLLTINIKGNVYVVPFAPQGKMNMDDIFVDQRMLLALQESIAKQNGVSVQEVHGLTKEEAIKAMENSRSLVYRYKIDGGDYEYRSLDRTDETVDLVELFHETPDQAEQTLKDAFKRTNIDLTTPSGGNPDFIMDVKAPNAEKLAAANIPHRDLEKSHIIINVDPELRDYVDVIAYKGTQFKLRFKKEFKDRPQLLISRQDLIASHRYFGAPRITKITLKASPVSDSFVEEMNGYSSLVKWWGLKQVERGQKEITERNNIFGGAKEYAAFLKEHDITNEDFIRLTHEEMTGRRLIDDSENKAAIEAYKATFKMLTLGKDEIEAKHTGEEINEIVTGFLKFMRNPSNRKKITGLEELFQKAQEQNVVGRSLTLDTMNETSIMIDQMLRLYMQKERSDITAALNTAEMMHAVNLVSVNAFTDVTKQYEKVKAAKTEKQKQLELKRLKSVLGSDGRLLIFERITMQALGQTSIVQTQPSTKAKMDKLAELTSLFMGKIVAQIKGLTGADMEKIDLPYIGSMAGAFMHKKNERLADLDLYQNLGFNTFDSLSGLANISPYDGLKLEVDGKISGKRTLEAELAMAIIEIEYPHNGDLDQALETPKEFFGQPLALQMIHEAPKFMSIEQMQDMEEIETTGVVTEITADTFEKFVALVNQVRELQMTPPSATGYMGFDVGPDGGFAHRAKIVVTPLSVKHFLFGKCGNASWGVDGKVQVFATAEHPDLEKYMITGSSVKGIIRAGAASKVTYYQFGILSFGEKEAKEEPVAPQDDEKTAEREAPPEEGDVPKDAEGPQGQAGDNTTTNPLEGDTESTPAATGDKGGDGSSRSGESNTNNNPF